MFFSKLPKEIQGAIFQLTKDKEFQHRFATDKELDELDNLKNNPAEELKALQAVLGLDLSFTGQKTKLLTPAKWAYLWAVNSPFVTSEKSPTEIDIDFFLYILDNGVEDGDIVSSFNKSIGYVKQANLTYEEGLNLVINSIRVAFRPLNLFPKRQGNTNRKPMFDADWITSLVARVHSVTGESPKKIMNEMSLTAACYYFAQYARMNGDDTIYKRSEEEILIAQDRRAVEMICERLIELNVIKREEYFKYLTIMTTNPEK